MIRYTLNCDKGHTFESWFANSAAYDEQAKRSLIACPVCNSHQGREGDYGAAARPQRNRRRVSGANAGAHPRRTARSTFAGRDDVAGRTRAAQEAQRAARAYRQERGLCRATLSRAGAQDPLRRGRAARSTARRHRKRPRNCTRKASPSLRCRSCRTSLIEALRRSQFAQITRRMAQRFDLNGSARPCAVRGMNCAMPSAPWETGVARAAVWRYVRPCCSARFAAF